MSSELQRGPRFTPRINLFRVARSASTPAFRLLVVTGRLLGLIPRRVQAAPGRPKHILIVHLSNHVGDTVMLLPMIEALRAARPADRIECVVQTPIDDFLRLTRCIDRIYAADLGSGPTSTLWLEAQRSLALIGFYWRSLRKVSPDICIIPRWGCGFRDLALSYLMQAPDRIGFHSNDFNRAQPPASYRDQLLTRTVRGAQGMHDPAKFLYLLEQAGLIAPVDRESIGAAPLASMQNVAATVDWPGLAARLGINPQAAYAVIAPGASAARRVWPVERWAAVIADLHARGLAAVLLTGKQDAHIAQLAYERLPSACRARTVLVAGTTTLAESCSLIAHSSLFVGNDSGPGHLAGALGIPCVIVCIAPQGSDPDGPSAPERIRPMGWRVTCLRPRQALAPCTDYCKAEQAHCILQIEAEEAIEAISSLLPRTVSKLT